MQWVPGKLLLSSGQSFSGFVPSGQLLSECHEIVFTTGMTGYVESLTDPSYAGQILAFTFPLIGNYGVPLSSDWESEKIHAGGVVVGELSAFESHFASTCSLQTWLKKQCIPCITQVDTRALTKILRTQGSTQGRIAADSITQGVTFPYTTKHLVHKVSPREVKSLGKSGPLVVVVDCGMKQNILRCLLQREIRILHVPYDFDYTNEPYDGLFLSNGPGDPEMCVETIRILQKALQKPKPIFGICLGAQLLALAIGAKTYKLKFGHRGHNHPCRDERRDRCLLTSQNHGYAIDENSLPPDWEVTFRHLNDRSVEGIAHRSLPYFAVQFHPESAPGPTDASYLFEYFMQMLRS